MRNISRRIDAMEKRLEIGQHKKPKTLLILVLLKGRKVTPEDKEELGANETWITYQEQLQAQQKANTERLKDNPNGLGAIITIDLDVDEEYQARATKSNQKQPIFRKLSQQDR